MNILDKTIEIVAPVHAIKRRVARKALSAINSGYGNYGANGTKKSMRGWTHSGGSAKEDIEDNVDTLRQRSRDLYMGVPVAAAALKTKRTNVIAGGLVPTPTIDADFLKLTEEQRTELHDTVKREFSLWAENTLCDCTRIDNFYGLQQLAFLSYCMNGDAMALLPMNGKTMPGQAYSLRVKLIEADRICSPDDYDRLSPCNVKGHRVERIIQGIETDEDGAVVAYWIRNKHPLSDLSYQSNGIEWKRVEAYGKKTGRRNVLHIMNRERIDQLRGVPMLAPVIEAIKQLGRYTDAEITAAIISSYFTVFVTPESVSNIPPFGEAIPTEQQVDAPDLGSIELAPGLIVGTNPGETITFADPKHPVTPYDSFTMAMIKHIASALEMPVEILLKQFTTSYSAARGALNEFWRVCDMERKNFVGDFCQPIYEEWFSEAVARGRIKAPGFFENPAIRSAYTKCTWNGPSRTNLNPVQEAQAAVLRVEQGFSTAEQETAQMTGGDFAQNIRQRLDEAKAKSEVDKLTVQTAETQIGGNTNA